MRKRLVYIALIVTLIVSMCVPAYGYGGIDNGESAAAADSETISSASFAVSADQAKGKTYTNLVLFAYFQDRENDYFSDKNNAAEIIDIYNGSHGRSFAGYMRTISGGKFEVLNVFPQYDPDTGIINAAKIPVNYSDALNGNIDSIIIEKTLETLRIDDAYLDLNNDGYVDNIMVVLQGGDGDKESTNVSFTAHKSDYPGSMKIGSKRIGTYNMLNTKRLTEDVLAGEGGLIAHEFLHSLGYPDLYEPSGTGHPVFTWDIMAASSPYPAWPLAYLRMRFTNWIDIETVTESGHLTLSAPGTAGGDQAYIIKSPLNEHEFFVVEMRRKGRTYDEKYQFDHDSLDAKISAYMNEGEAGLIVYRVDTTVEGLSNYHGKTGIYVFRPQTGESDQRQAVQKAYLSPKSGRTSIGTADMSKGLRDGALTFTDGTNSGIEIKNVADSGDNMVCDVVIPSKDDFDLWENTSFASTAVTNDNTRAAAVAVYNGVPYLVANQDHRFSLYKYGAGGWSAVGQGWDANLPISAELSLIPHGGKLYLGYIDKQGDFRLISIDPSTGTRSELADMTGGHNGFAMSEINDTLYVVYDEDYGAKAKLLRLNGGKLEDQGAYFKGSGGQPQIAGAGNDIYVSFRNVSGNKIQVYRYNKANDFTLISDGSISANSYGLVSFNNRLGVVATGSQTVLYSYDGKKWNAGKSAAVSCFDPKFTTAQGNLYMLTSSLSGDGYTYVYQYAPETDSWVAEGGIVDAPSQQITLTASPDHLYIGYILTDGKIIRVKQKAVANKLLSISVKPPTKTVYNKNEAVSTAGMAVTAKYQKGDRKLSAGEYALTGFSTEAVGSHAAKVTYANKEAGFSYQVKDVAKTVVPKPVVKKYNISYKLNGGVNNKQNPAQYTTKDIKLKNPTRKGYMFKGWYTSGSYKTKISTIAAKSARNTTVYAKWSKVSVSKVKLSSVKNKKGKKAAVRFKKVSSVKGYQVLYGTKKSFKGAKAVTVKSTSVTLKNLKKNKKYYVKVRAYKTDSAGKRVYGKYSNVKTVRIKK